jgi:3-hydroxyisobutyrate dehydrogenase-like beta-hydroxyacid dehydrogenase
VSKIAFLGLGNMGTPMATRLLNAGHDVIAWNRSAPRSAPLAQVGASVAVLSIMLVCVVSYDVREGDLHLSRKEVDHERL